MIRFPHAYKQVQPYTNNIAVEGYWKSHSYRTQSPILIKTVE